MDPVNNGYTKIPNHLMDSFLKASLSSSENYVFLAIMRKIYGWHKEKDTISFQQLADLTGISRRMVIHCIQTLEAKNMIVKTSMGEKKASTISIQEDTALWIQTPSKYKNNWHNKSTQVVKAISPDVHLVKAISPELVKAVSPDLVKALSPTKERKKKKEITIGALFELPNWIPKEPWEAFLEMRRKIRKPLTEYGKKRIVEQLLKIGGDPAEVLDQSTANSWQGVFPPRRYEDGSAANNRRFGRFEGKEPYHSPEARDALEAARRASQRMRDKRAHKPPLDPNQTDTRGDSG